MNITRIYKTIGDWVRLTINLSKCSGQKIPILQGNINAVGAKIASFLQSCFDQTPDTKSVKFLNRFLEIFPIRGTTPGEIIKVGAGLKKSGGRLANNKLVKCIRKLFPCWKEKLFLLSSEGLGYCDNVDDCNLKDNILLDCTLQVSCSKDSTVGKFTIVLRTSSRKMKLRVAGILDGFSWLYAFTKAIERSRYCKIHRFASFAPVCEENYAKWYINAENYFFDIADALKKASSKIYITGWMLSPGLYLKRPAKLNSEFDEDHEYRLDQLLLAAANRGCRIHILLYKEFDHALPNNSKYVRDYLQGLHKNITVLRHPGALIMLWSHHEKMVIIDQAIAFMGGLDLCFGRYDNDLYSLRETDGSMKGEYLFPGQDYYNVRIKEFRNVQNWRQPIIDPTSQPRMPWRDITVQLRGEIVKDTTRHFIQYWNFAKIDLSMKKEKALYRHVSQISAEVNSAAFISQKILSEMNIEDSSREYSEKGENTNPKNSRGVSLKNPTLKITNPIPNDLNPSFTITDQFSLLKLPNKGSFDQREEDIKIIRSINTLHEKLPHPEMRSHTGCSLVKKQKTQQLMPSFGDFEVPDFFKTMSVEEDGQGEREEWFTKKKTLMGKLVYIVSNLER